MKIYTIRWLCVAWLFMPAIAAKAQFLADGPSRENNLPSYDNIGLDSSMALWMSLGAGLKNNNFPELNLHLKEFCFNLSQKRSKFKSEEYFLWYVFNKTHQDFLRNYQCNVPFYKIFSSKAYNCVTGTAFYAMIFCQLGYRVEIRETKDHAYLIIHLSDRRLMIESTDSQNGFISDQRQIWKKEQAMAEGGKRALIHQISLINLCGLQFYNQAVKHYYNHQYDDANYLLEKGMGFYPASSKIWYLHRKINVLQVSYSHAGN